MKNLLKLNPLTFMVAVSFMLAYVQGTAQENRLSELVQKNRSTENFKTLTPFKVSHNESIYSIVNRGTVLTINEIDLKQITEDRSKAISLTIPDENGTNYQLELVKAYIGDKGGFMDVTIKGNHEPRKVKISSGLHYRGIIKGNENSYAAVSIHENKITGIISEGNGNMVLQQLKDTKDQYIFYNDRDLIQPRSAECGLTDNMSAPGNNLKGGNNSVMATNTDCKVVKFYYECDYQMYQDFGNDVNAVVNFITDAFTQASTLFFNEGVICEIANPIVVWDASDFILDKYPIWGYPPADMFPVLSTVVAETGSSFEGDIAHFVTTRTDIHPGHPFGLAQVINGLCNKYESHILIDIDEYTVLPVPDFSLMVFIMAHEAGHILGSRHTHACVWNGNNTALDDCPGGVEPYNGCNVGTPPPSIYTVMSYCALPDLQAGFGPQPGALIYNNVSNAQCLDGSAEFIPVNLYYDDVEYRMRWDNVPGATCYQVQFKLDVNDGCEYEDEWITQIPNSECENSMLVTSLIPNPLMSATTYVWRVRSDCSPYSEVSTFTTIDENCPNPANTTTYSITAHSATLCWDNCASTASTYDVRIRKINAIPCTNCSGWDATYTSIPHNYYRVLDLDVHTYFFDRPYEWQVKNSSNSNWSGPSYFMTDPDGYSSLVFNTCASYGSDPSNYYITEVDLAGYQNSTGSATGGYAEYIDENGTSDTYAHEWSPADSYTLEANVNSSLDNVFITVFIDWNRDDDYFDKGEDAIRLFNEYGILSGSGSITGNCEIPNSFVPGWTTLRVSYNSPQGNMYAPIAPHQCGDNEFAEVEDYAVFLYPEVTCPSPKFAFTIKSNLNINIYPNPATDYLKLYVNDVNDSETMFANIYNVTGQCIKKVPVNQSTSQIDVSGLARGVYQISVSQNNIVQKNMKFIKL